MSADPGASEHGLDDSDWNLLIERIDEQKVHAYCRLGRLHRRTASRRERREMEL